ncbi:stress responsive A/B barrel domain protein [Lentithecium fluviatile CBS 122367]|uniref:Stress responsive A/B barrel domain protein n=1 Tax=Lentithecium fluviatile CBS 122367 TaxID=1168545 RepID=A0A6G1JQ28_9PLEO|nr:stress responsive A/B barrel domain protein [Lentithecium fluviatile CBS 122367]
MQTDNPATTHIVLFKFKDSATPFQIKDITSRMISLGRQCMRPGTRTPYIKSITGGRDSSIENLQEGISHAFIVQFQSNEDRDYYVNEDPVHQAFKDAAGAYLEKAVVVDFQEGVFTYADTF